jgi:hypothetical protein
VRTAPRQLLGRSSTRPSRRSRRTLRASVFERNQIVAASSDHANQTGQSTGEPSRLNVRRLAYVVLVNASGRSRGAGRSAIGGLDGDDGFVVMLCTMRVQADSKSRAFPR